MSDEPLEKCPACGSTRMYGVEVQHIYDGVLYWECGRCMWRWHRWPVGSHLRRLAMPFVENASPTGRT